MKKRFLLFILIFSVSQMMFSLEFRLEYEQFLDKKFLANQKNIQYLMSGQKAFFVDDTTVAILSHSNHGSGLFLLNYLDNTIQEKPLDFINGFTVLKDLFPLDIENNVVICHYDKSYSDKQYVAINLNDDSYSFISEEENNEQAAKTILFYHPDWPLKNEQWISGNYQLHFFTDEETDNDWWWVEQSFLKIALVQSDTFIQSHGYMGLDNPLITNYIQTLKKSNGDSLIILGNAYACYDINREKLVILTPCELNAKGELDMGTDTLFIYKLIRDATCNDTRVRIREEPNLSCATLSHLNPGDAVKIIDKSDEPLEIDGETWYWYKVESDMLPDGWVYGKYLDIEE